MQTSNRQIRESLRQPQLLIVFSHLRWDFVWQRPQHILSRLAQNYDVVVVEEPQFCSGSQQPFLSRQRRDGVTILTPCIPAADGLTWGFTGASNPIIAELLEEDSELRVRIDSSLPDPVVWYYTPMALGALPDIVRPSVVVFDVMDELSAFRGAPSTLRAQESALLDHADVVFAGGPSLFRQRQSRHRNIHCFPSGVDADHFAAGEPGIDLQSLPKPIVGFYGVIDERMDLGLVEGIADLRPDWSIVLIGPVAKISEAELPRRTNIHYFGKRSYPELPSLLASFDAAMLPFARNDSTRFISPTKTLEYLAAGKPVVSTSIADVIDLYGAVVEIADAPTDFVAAIERLWEEVGPELSARRSATRELLDVHNWDAIAEAMKHEIESVHQRRAREAAVRLGMRDVTSPGGSADNPLFDRNPGGMVAEPIGHQR